MELRDRTALKRTEPHQSAPDFVNSKGLALRHRIDANAEQIELRFRRAAGYEFLHSFD
jgi:hypothetical protein